MREVTGEMAANRHGIWKKLGHYLLLILAGIAINLGLSKIIAVLNLPLYLDSIGTVVVSMLGGFVPGIVVGYATNLLKALFVDCDSL